MKTTHFLFVSQALIGRTVVMADGDEIGVVEGVIEPPQPDGHTHLVVTVTHAPASSSTQWYVPRTAVHAVTDTVVILGTRADWVESHRWTMPPEQCD